MNAHTLLVRPDGAVRAPWAIVFFLFAAALATGFFATILYPLAALTPVIQWARDWRIPLAALADCAAFLGATWLARRIIDGAKERPWDAVGLGRDALRPRGLLVGLAAGALTILVPCALLVAAGRFSFATTAGLDGWSSAARVAFFQLVPFAALEELVMRGYVLTVLVVAIRPPRAIALTSVMFGLLHLANPEPSAVAIIGVMMGGALLAAVRLATGSLYAAIVAHFAWNFAQAVVLAAPVSGLALPTPGYRLVDHGPGWLTGGSWGPEGGLAAAAAMIVTTFLLLRRPLNGHLGLQPTPET